MILKEFNYYLKKGTTLEEIQGSLIKKVNKWCDPFTGCVAHVFDTVLLKHWIVASDNVVNLYKLGENVLLFSDFKKVDDLLNTKADKSTTYIKTEVYNKTETYNKTEVDTRVNAKANANAVVALTGNQTIAGNKTLSGATTFNGAITSKGANTFTGNNIFNTGQVTFNNKAPISSVAPTAANHLATKAYVDGINTTLTGGINTKANANSTVNLTGNQTIAGIKTFSSPVVVPNATANTHAVNLAQLNTKANQATTYTKTEVNNLVNAKANANATVNLTGNQTIQGVKTFSSPPASATNPTANNQVANKAYVDTVANTKANANATVNLTGNQRIEGVKTFSAVPVCSVLPTTDNQLANRNYVKKRGGFVNVNFNLASGQGILIDLNLGINFNVIVQPGVSANMRVINAASNIGQSGEIYVANGAGVSSFSAPFNFRVAQSGFGNNEVFSYLVVSANLVRITRS